MFTDIVAVRYNLMVTSRILGKMKPGLNKEGASLTSSLEALSVSMISIRWRRSIGQQETYPKNHAPLLASVPFCFHARK